MSLFTREIADLLEAVTSPLLADPSEAEAASDEAWDATHKAQNSQHPEDTQIAAAKHRKAWDLLDSFLSKHGANMPKHIYKALDNKADSHLNAMNHYHSNLKVPDEGEQAEWGYFDDFQDKKDWTDHRIPTILTQSIEAGKQAKTANDHVFALAAYDATLQKLRKYREDNWDDHPAGDLDDLEFGLTTARQFHGNMFQHLQKKGEGLPEPQDPSFAQPKRPILPNN